MSVTNNIFCPECDDILDISRVPPKKIYNIDVSPSSVSEEEEDKIGTIISKLLKEKTDNDVDDLIENVKIEQITSHSLYQKLDKTKKANVSEKLEKLFAKTDISTQAFYVCKTCSWSQKIKPKTQILSKMGNKSQKSYLNLDKYQNMADSKILPRSRNYICPNEDCPGIEDPIKHEAVFYRIDGTMDTMYTCCACKSVFGAK
jgi:hypothetical protein